MNPLPAQSWIRHLQLTEHPEGGYYREAYRSPLSFTANQLPAVFNGSRQACTHIYFLLTSDNFSAFHRIFSDEIWHFYHGDPLLIHEIDSQGELAVHHLGNQLAPGQQLSMVIRGGNWFASEVAPGGSYSLVGCTVSPGFDFADFELADKTSLQEIYPQHSDLIGRLCR